MATKELTVVGEGKTPSEGSGERGGRGGSGLGQTWFFPSNCASRHTLPMLAINRRNSILVLSLPDWFGKKTFKLSIQR